MCSNDFLDSTSQTTATRSMTPNNHNGNGDEDPVGHYLPISLNHDRKDNQRFDQFTSNNRFF